MSDADPNPAAEAGSPRAELDVQRAVLARLRGKPGPGWPVDLTGAPMIVDTDNGSDPDDAFALALAALKVAELELVLTGAETGPRAGGYGQRARAARWLLDACGRVAIPVAAGAALTDIDHFVLAGTIPDDVPAADPADVEDAVRYLAGLSKGPVRWVGLAPMSNLARIIVEGPEVAARLRVTQMGAAIHCRHPERAEHNVRLDLDTVMALVECGSGALSVKRLRGVSLGLVALPSAMISGMGSRASFASPVRGGARGRRAQAGMAASVRAGPSRGGSVHDVPGPVAAGAFPLPAHARRRADLGAAGRAGARGAPVLLRQPGL